LTSATWEVCFVNVNYGVKGVRQNAMVTTSGDKQPTLADVARASAVSHQTVSRVVNNHPNVSDKTRQRVLKAIDELSYRPNRAAKGLVTSKSGVIGIISFGTNYFGPGQMFTEIERTVRARGYGLTLRNIDAPSAQQLQGAIDDLASHSVDGIVINAPSVDLDPGQLLSIRRPLPVVMTDVPKHAQLPSVVLDQTEGLKLATQHLIGLGHRRIAEISGPLNWYSAVERHEAWVATVREAGLTPGPNGVGDWTASSGYRTARRLLATAEPFTALAVGNDQMALGAMRALREHGLKVPEDVSVVGFDDIPEASFFEPPLTTVRQDFIAMGQQAVDYLLALIQRPETPHHQRMLYPRLIERSSTARVPS
jgi:DNA-binding LacI/PurR family transcriptional regulator